MKTYKTSDKIVAVIFFSVILFIVGIFGVGVFKVWSNAIALHNNSYEGEGTLLYYTKETGARGRRGGKFSVAHIEYVDKDGNKKEFQSTSHADYYVGEKVKILIPTTKDGYPQDSRRSIWFAPIVSSLALLLFLFLLPYVYILN